MSKPSPKMEASDADPPVDVEKNALKYFSRTNFINQKVVSQQKLLMKHMGNHWNELQPERKDALIDLLFVGDDVREIFACKPSSLSTQEDPIQESFPRLYCNSGQKINVDFENDLWTWRDEHSGPFSWMSRSQQDLTLIDLEPENISKPQPKTAKTESEEKPQESEPQFVYPSNSWAHSVIEEYHKNEKDIILTPSTSMNLTSARVESSLQEMNPAYDDSCDDLTPAPLSSDRGPGEVAGEMNAANDSAADQKYKGKDKSRRSPSPKKIPRSGSFRKSPVKKADQDEQACIVAEDPDGEDGRNAFSNPLMESEWSSFVGDEAPARPEQITHAPEAMTIDRGSETLTASPSHGDTVQLISPSDSPSQTSAVWKKTDPSSSSNWSEESTPDHTTHLLKGSKMEDQSYKSPLHQSYGLGAQPGVNPSDHYLQSEHAEVMATGQLDSQEVDEVLRVETDGQDFMVTSEVETKRDSSLLKTGFDFLDNW